MSEPAWSGRLWQRPDLMHWWRPLHWSPTNNHILTLAGLIAWWRYNMTDLFLILFTWWCVICIVIKSNKEIINFRCVKNRTLICHGNGSTYSLPHVPFAMTIMVVRNVFLPRGCHHHLAAGFCLFGFCCSFCFGWILFPINKRRGGRRPNTIFWCLVAPFIIP